MYRFSLLNSHESPETLEPKLSPSSSVGAVMAPPLVSTIHATHLHDDDPLPAPAPAPIPYPGDGPPIEDPSLPPSGPAGPGS